VIFARGCDVVERLDQGRRVLDGGRGGKKSGKYDADEQVVGCRGKIGRELCLMVPGFVEHSMGYLAGLAEKAQVGGSRRSSGVEHKNAI